MREDRESNSICNLIGGGTECSSAGISYKKHLRDCLFHGLYKQLCNSMCYLYDDMRIMYPQLMTAAHKVESEQED